MGISDRREVSVIVRPHRIRLEAANGGVLGTVKSVTYLGDIIQYDVDLDGVTVAVEVSSQSSLDKRCSLDDDVSDSWQKTMHWCSMRTEL